MNDYAIYFESSAYSLGDRIMGRQSAGTALLAAIAATKPDRVFCYADSHGAASNFARTLARLGAPRTGIDWIPFNKSQRLSEAGLLYRPDPVLSSHAWQRLSNSDPRAYSLCGITHTISSHGPMTAFSEYLTAPIEPWDAVICTSRPAHDAVLHVVERQSEYLAERFGVKEISLPQFPIIPLGVHTKDFATSEDSRLAARARLGIASDEIVVLFAGRLVIHAKAHPLPMYLALEQASAGYKIVLLQAGQAPRPEMLRIFTEDPKRYCPSVRTLTIDGGNADLYRAAWSAADIFTSPSDNIQETFGLTPVEAMAAGLPSIVSDWNGYKDTVRDEVDGYRVPTLALPPGSGGELAEHYDLGLDDYDRYIGYSSQLVSVSVEGLSIAFKKMFSSKDLRKNMGDAAQRRAQEQFDWSVIFGRYQNLWTELAEIRRSTPSSQMRLTRRRRPDRADPFTMFASYPTFHTETGVAFRRRRGIGIPEIDARRALPSISFAKPVLPPPELVEALLEAVTASWTPFNDIRMLLPKFDRASIAAGLTWLSKIGALDFQKYE